MKNLIITGALVSSSLISFAQGNQADIQQHGTNNSHTVQQTGASEILTLIQGTAADPSHRSEAEVTMNGLSNEVYIVQAGEEHAARVTAEGESNNIRIAQSGFLQVANVEVLDNASPVGNQVDVQQQGETNGAAVSIQGGSGHDFQIRQAGADNSASIRQYYSSDNVFSIDQQGAANQARIQQESFDDGDQATITQNGVANAARISLADADGISPTRDNLATIEQVGGGNNATIEQKTPSAILYTADAPALIANNEASIIQHGNRNNALLVQYGSDNFGKIQQSGTLNEASLTQAGMGDIANVTQTGSGNVSQVSQGVALP